MWNIVSIVASPSSSSRSTQLSRYVSQSLAELGFGVAQIDLRDLPAEPLLRGRADAPLLRDIVALVQEAPALVIVSPTYKASYTGILKTFFDLLPPRAFENKAALPLMIGGSPAHSLALDHALVPVLRELGTSHVAQGLFLLDSSFSEVEGHLQFAPGIENKLEKAVQDFVQVLPVHPTEILHA
jgi:FMN reductase